MQKILIQAGHAGRTSGATGAPGEKEFNLDVSLKLEGELKKLGYQTRVVTADPKDSEIAGDWDLFLAVHYDANIYNDNGGFVDFPEPSTDGATYESQRIAKCIEDKYFSVTGIKNMPNRRNRKTKYYYMWSKISSKTPCVIIECGVGMRKPKDYDVLHDNCNLVVKGLLEGIKYAFGWQDPNLPTCEQKLIDCRLEIGDIKKTYQEELKKLNVRVAYLENKIKEIKELCIINI